MSNPLSRFGVRMLRLAYGPDAQQMVDRYWPDLQEVFSYVMGTFMTDLNGVLRANKGKDIPVSSCRRRNASLCLD